MKKLINYGGIIILIAWVLWAFIVPTFAQSSELIMLFSGGEWKPTDVDGNTLAYYDGNEGLTTSGWEDQFSTHDIVFHDTPAITADATPLRDAVLFNGTNEGGTVATPTTTQPYTIYLVLKMVLWVNSDRVMDDGAVLNGKLLFMDGTTPNLTYYAGTTVGNDPDLTIGTYGIQTMVFNGASSEIRTNLETAVVSDAGASNSSGITIGEAFNNTGESNVEIAYIIIRSGADNTATQNLIINKLVTLTGITL